MTEKMSWSPPLPCAYPDNEDQITIAQLARYMLWDAMGNAQYKPVLSQLD